MLRVDQAHVIRHKVLVEKRPIRAVAREMGVARNTVRKYRTTPVPRRAESGPRPQPVREAVERRIHALLSDKRLTSEKQRWTAPTLREALQTEGLEASERTVRRCMAEWKTDVGSGVT
jgi:transposase